MRSDIKWFAALFAISAVMGPNAYAGGGTVKSKSAMVKADIDRARASDAYHCAPKELALAEANLDFAQAEYEQGDSGRAMQHLAIAEKNAKQAIILSKDCGPKKIMVAPPKPVLKIQKSDKDGDGVPDVDDICPDIPGPVITHGCPVVADTDEDGIPDDVDRCPNDPEDIDQFEDEDGCPDADNDGDGILDMDDACMYEAGVRNDDPAKNGCPLKDRDGDGIFDDYDACPDVPGIKSDDPAKNGCPDKDGDGIFDSEDACPDVPGIRSDDPVKNGCPDRDGDGIFDSEDACPDEPGVKSSDPEKNGCPDKDGDGFIDKVDACPEEPGVFHPLDNSKNGCPMLDKDGDGIPDDEDACPDKPGIPDPNKKKNGCPRMLRMVVVKADKIEIKKQINFTVGKATIKGKQSFQILDEVAQVLVAEPRIKKLRVEGHTDSVGKAAFNQKLSQNRATSVMQYLIKKGIDPERLEAVGFGPDKPIADNKTAKGRALNRRTEFNVVDQ